MLSVSHHQREKLSCFNSRRCSMKNRFATSNEISGRTETNRLPGTGQPRESMCSRRRFRRRARIPGRGICRANRQALNTWLSSRFKVARDWTGRRSATIESARLTVNARGPGTRPATRRESSDCLQKAIETK